MRVPLLAVAVVSVVTSCRVQESEWAGHEVEVTRWYDVQEVAVQNDVWRFRPYERSDGELCVAYNGPSIGGGKCFVAGWAVEVDIVEGQEGNVVFGTAAPETDHVVVPTSGGSPIEIEPNVVVGDTKMFFTPVINDEVLLRTNEVAALNASGKKLGNEHWNVGDGDCDWAGPWDGILDRDEPNQGEPCK